MSDDWWDNFLGWIGLAVFFTLLIGAFIAGYIFNDLIVEPGAVNPGFSVP